MEVKEETTPSQLTPLEKGVLNACMRMEKCLHNAIQIVLFVEKSADRSSGLTREFMQELSNAFDKLLREEVLKNKLDEYQFNFSISTYGTPSDCTFSVSGRIGELELTKRDFTVHWTEDILSAQETGLLP